MLTDGLQKIIKHAAQSVPYYNNLFEGQQISFDEIHSIDEFRRIPLLTKSMIQDDPQKFISAKYNKFPQNQNLILRRTSGSTGNYLKVYWDVKDHICSLAGVWLLRKSNFNIYPRDKYCYFYTTDYINNKLIESGDMKKSRLDRFIGFSKIGLNGERLIEIYEQIVEFSPKWMLLQPSIAQLLADCVVENNLPRLPELEYIEFNGETLFDDVRRQVEDVFGCMTGNQYGCIESNSIALECEEKHLHCITSNVFIEILKDGLPVEDGEEGDIIITSLSNHAMPFIRYKTGDRGRLVTDIRCACGNNSPVLELVKARENEFILTADNQRITPFVFMYPIEHINEKIGNIIRQYQVVQTGFDEFTVKLVIKKSYAGWKESVAELFQSYVKEPALQHAKWSFEFCDALFPDENGKLAFFYNKLLLAERKQ